MFFDQILPPVIRDSSLMKLPLRLVFRNDFKIVWNFRQRFPLMTDEEIRETYEKLARHALKSDTDINRRCLDLLEIAIVEKKLLDVGCGTGKLAELSGFLEYVGVDFVRHPVWDDLSAGAVSFHEMPINNLPFNDHSFDLVVCAHVLEHVRNPVQILNEIKRVAKDQAIIILPRERSYKAGFNLHVNHFQYQWEIERLLSEIEIVSSSIELIDGDFYCLVNFR